MKIKRIAVIMALIIIMTNSVYATEIQNHIETTTSQISPEETVTKETNTIPVNIEEKVVDDINYIYKTFNSSIQLMDSEVIEKSFEQDGYLYEYMSINKDTEKTTETKEVSQSIKEEMDTKDLETIISKLPNEVFYDDGFYAGSLFLDSSTITTEVIDYKTSSWTDTATKTFDGLMYQDPTYIPQTALKNGNTLKLVDVNWNVTESAIAGDTYVPTQYRAVATYEKTFTQKTPTGYYIDAEYKGNVSKEEISNYIYEVEYKGYPISEPVIITDDEPVDSESNNIISIGTLFVIKLLIVLMIIAGLGLGIYCLMNYLKSNRGVKIYNLINDEYVYLGIQTLEKENPVVDLNMFDELIESDEFTFVFDWLFTRRNFGKNILVTYKNVNDRVSLATKGEVKFIFQSDKVIEIV